MTFEVVDFGEVDFGEVVDFSEVDFCKVVDFGEVDFCELVDFCEVVDFGEVVDFCEVVDFPGPASRDRGSRNSKSSKDRLSSAASCLLPKVNFVSHKVFQSRFAEGNFLANPSTYPLLSLM